MLEKYQVSSILGLLFLWTLLGITPCRFVEVDLPKVPRKKMDPLVNADNDYAMLDELLLEGGATQTLSVNPVDLSLQKTENVVNLEVPKQRYVLVETAEEEMPSSKNKKVVSPASSGVTVTGKRVAETVELEAPRTKRTKPVNIPGHQDGVITFEVLAPEAPEIPRSKLARVLEEAGMADEAFIRRMVSDLKDPSLDKMLASGATPRENGDKMLRYLMRV